MSDEKKHQSYGLIKDNWLRENRRETQLIFMSKIGNSKSVFNNRKKQLNKSAKTRIIL